MLKFKDYKYERPDIEGYKKEAVSLLDKFKVADSVEEQFEVMNELIQKEKDIFTMLEICYIRNSIDTRDDFYDKEVAFMDEMMPEVEGIKTKYYKTILDSKHRNQLEEKFGSLLFKKAENQIQTFDDCILEDLKKENKLSTEYRKLIASAEIEFDNKTLNLSQMTPYRESNNRGTRKLANEAYFGFLNSKRDELDRIYDELVAVRTEMAKKLGYDSFTELGYKRMERLDYNQDMVQVFRDQVRDHIVPICTELRERQQKRLDYDTFKYFDENYRFLSGNPIPKGDPDWIVSKAVKMYKELSPETHDFFTFMRDRELLDLVTKKGKAGGGYCTYIPNYESPFIFSNFNGTLGDVTVLTHEVGHAFQCYSSKDAIVPEYNWPTSEAAEIHSMGMEFITWPWMDEFFLEDGDKFRYVHLEEGLQFIPYGVSVDEFQHYVYNNPKASPSERRAKWREIEKKYLPHLDYDGMDYLETGGFWQKQAHIYEMPFYYIDYTLAQICAFQYLVKSLDNREAAWDSYLKLCKAGGKDSFLGLLNLAGLESPFEAGTVEKITKVIKAWLDQVDDTKF
ncbi:M3 family oligoendopeptidase [Acidaminobacter sp. JC074]|uniref:M3 family oligoendopeptidase n=1 Tax=Acidaminobacter sp. JC074 TaxID=2530199 RepID=UPI001F0EBBFA|nr:M3 family oligoendopeptidase [Acidaminobacter sp. JC074]MCH4890776.1 M3 family oligoendopeptidase [Acidaminobacter sp. JC074]